MLVEAIDHVFSLEKRRTFVQPKLILSSFVVWRRRTNKLLIPVGWNRPGYLNLCPCFCPTSLWRIGGHFVPSKKAPRSKRFQHKRSQTKITNKTTRQATKRK